MNEVRTNMTGTAGAGTKDCGGGFGAPNTNFSLRSGSGSLHNSGKNILPRIGNKKKTGQQLVGAAVGELESPARD